ncbi:MerR family transcriptional regulator [Amycolatopsis sp. NPDC004368]
MENDPALPIGDLARQAGLSVKAVRYYSDIGLVPTAGRDAAGRRQYGAAAAARLSLIKILRELGLGIRTIRAVLEREAELAEVAGREVERIESQIKELRMRQEILRAIARRGLEPKELKSLSTKERRNLIREFLDAVFSELRPRTNGLERTLTPELPDDPTPDQVGAWAELTRLTSDPEFRTRLRRLAERHTATKDVTARVAELDHEGDPRGPAGAKAVEKINPTKADLTRLQEADDPSRDRYLELLATVNGWAAPTPLAPKLKWFRQAASHHSPNLLAR